MANQQLFSFMAGSAAALQKPALGCPSESASEPKKEPAGGSLAGGSPAIAARRYRCCRFPAALLQESGSWRIFVRGKSVRGKGWGAAGGNATGAEQASRRSTVLSRLRSQLNQLGTLRRDRSPTFSTGSAQIDSWLPGAGLHPMAMTEWIAAHDSAAAGSLAMLAAANRLQQVPDRPLVIVDCEGTFYPPAAVSLGIPPERILLLRPPALGDALWAIDQSLRSGAVAAVWASLTVTLDNRDARRLQLAAEAGRTPGLLVRGFEARGKPSFSEVQFYVAPSRQQVSRQVSSAPAISLTLDRARGVVTGRQVDLWIDDQANLHSFNHVSGQTNETAAEHLAAQLANPAIAKRSRAHRLPKPSVVRSA